MSFTLHVVDPWPPVAERRPGMMWRDPEWDDEGDGRECWWIVLPDTTGLCGTPGHPSQITWRTTDRASAPPHEMWAVTGEPPNITVTPSIDVQCWVVENGQSVRKGSYWHGFITNGIGTP